MNTLAPLLRLRLIAWTAVATLGAQAQAAPQQITVLDAAGAPIEQAVVSVVVSGIKAQGAGQTVAEMPQRDRMFKPKVVVIPVGGAVNFPNLDTVRHHVYSFSSTRKFEIKLYAGVPAKPVIFDKPGTATLGCNIHDTMVGYVHVVDTPYYGKTNATGQVTLELPSGEHTLRIWTMGMGEMTPPAEFKLRVGAPVVHRVKQ
ncbi:MAG TPA: methylamine utilization protein [Aquabacterium sp.]|nr:methylamine utilization protein [Aquabacterium sp.]HRH27647.1 methylamine utilization protein [Aquabacterium sp.]